MTLERSGDELSSRAGRYVQQAGRHYKAFIPEPLPPKPPIEMKELMSLVSSADQALGRLDGSVLNLPNPDLFVSMYVRKEAVLSSQIEGTQSSLHDVLAAEAEIFTPNQPKDADEVISHVRAMNYGLERLKSLPLSVRLISEIHRELMSGLGVRGSELEPGEIRRSQNWIGPAGSTLNQAMFIPPPQNEVRPQLSDLEKFIHSNTEFPLLIKIGLIHSQFETIHPFLDGNGRIGRLLITFILCQQKILHKPVLYLSHYFKQHRTRYYEELQSVRDKGTWEQWLAFFLKGVLEVSQEAAKTTGEVLQLRENHRKLIADRFGGTADSGHRLLEHLYKHPVTNINTAGEVLGLTYPPASKLVNRMVDAGILVEVTGKSRNRAFRYKSYIDLFDDSP